MIKFRYKRKETAAIGSPANGESTDANKNANKLIEPKTNDVKADKLTTGSMKSDNIYNYSSNIDQSPNLLIQPKTSSEKEYMEDCIRAIVVSLFFVKITEFSSLIEKQAKKIQHFIQILNDRSTYSFLHSTHT